MTKEQKIIRAKVGLLELASSLRKFRLPIFEMRPSFATRGVLLGRQPERLRTRAGRRSWMYPEMVAAIAEAVIGPKPGMLIKRRAVSSFCASFARMRSSRAIASSRFRSCTTSGASASQLGQFAGKS